jgi:OmcA/MtrC family decaheme c-type cytochrome
VAADGGLPVVLQATPGASSAFAGWSNCPNQQTTFNAVTGNFCILPTGSVARTVWAYFKPSAFSVTVKPGQGGSITVDANPACTAAAGCTYPYAPGATVSLTATPPAGMLFYAWAGCASATATCSLKVDGPKQVSAGFFTATSYQLAVTVSGQGTVSNGLLPPNDISCPGKCGNTIAPGGSATLTATANSGQTFSAWYGCTSVSGASGEVCNIANAQGNQSVFAQFSSNGACGACHAKPPVDHTATAAALSCGACHPGTTANTAPVGHADGTVSYIGDIATDGFNVTILSATLAADKKPVIRAQFQNNAGQGIDMAQYYAQYQYKPAWQNVGSVSGQPRIAINGLNSDFTFDWTLCTTTMGATTNASTTVTLAAGDFSLPVSPGVYDITPNAYLRSTASGSRTATNGAEPVVPFAANKTYRIQMIAGRFGGAAKDVVTAANPRFELRPDGLTPLVTRNVVTDSACQACHDKFKIGFHDNMRIGANTCKVCHDPRPSEYKGNPIENMAAYNFIHRLHNGQDMYSWSDTDPSPLTTSMRWQNRFGWDGSPIGTATTPTREAILMAPSHDLYFEGGLQVNGGTAAIAVVDPELTIDCTICHNGSDGGIWMTKPSTKACSGCHNVDFTTGYAWTDPTTNASTAGAHIAGVTDAQCVGCHPPSGAIVAGSIYPVGAVHGKFYEPAHKYDFQSLTSPAWPAGGYNFVVNLTNVAVDGSGKPTFTVDMSLNGAAFDPYQSLTTANADAAKLNNYDQFGGRLATCAFQIAGPTSDYTVPATGSTAVSCTSASTVGAVTNWTTVAAGDATHAGTYTFKQASGSGFFSGKPDGYYTVAFEIMWQRVGAASNGDKIRKPFSANPNFLTVKKVGTAVTVVTGAELALNDRRAVVDFAKCNSCHQDLGFHSNRGRKGPDYCAMCHNPKLDNGTRARYKVSEARQASTFDPSFSTSLVYLPESVSLNVFIHRIHMGGELPSVSGMELFGTAAATASKWVQNPGVVKFGSTRSAFVGVDGGSTAASAATISDFTEFEMPNPMIRCDQCHISQGATKTWALNEGTGLAPIERTLEFCSPTTVGWDSAQWCNVTSTNGPAKYLKSTGAATIVTPPLKAVCTSCHDSAATDAHADSFTTNPMSTGAVENCAQCHGAGKGGDSITVHGTLP